MAGTSSRQQSASRAADTSSSRATALTTPERARRDDVVSVRLVLPFGIDPVEQLAGIRADELDQRRHAQRTTDVVDVQHEHDHADHHEEIGDDDGEARHRAAILEPHFAQGEHRMNERGDEQADRDLARLVAQDRLDDAR